MKTIANWIRFNLFYLGKPAWDTGVSPPELTNFLESASPGKALDVGCGTGTNLVTLASFDWQVVGVDLAWLSVLKARAKLRQMGCEGQVRYGDVTGSLELDESFDLVLDIGCYHSLTSQKRDIYRQRLNSWLNTGGTYLLYAHRQAEPGDSHGINDIDLDSFSQFLNLDWRQDSPELRPDGAGGRPATWARFTRLHQKEAKPGIFLL